jgi:multidrug efflux pump subunit AcrA (membrane-fusion protein)
MRKTLIIIIIIGVIIAAAAIRIGANRGQKQVEEVSQVIPVEVISVARGSVVSTCEVLGTVVADKKASVFPETMGRVTRVLVKEGSYVSKNSNLMAMRNETIGFEYEEGFIRAPISGNVASINVKVGSMVNPQSSVAMVVDYARVNVEFNVAETNVNCVGKNQKVNIMIDGLDREFSARVSEISPVIDEFTRTIAVKATTSNPKKLLRPGMTARVTINLGEKEDVLVIPKDALLDSYLFVVGDSTAERRDVVVGLVGDENVEILEGIAEGEDVVVIGQQRLAGGEKVNPVRSGTF